MGEFRFRTLIKTGRLVQAANSIKEKGVYDNEFVHLITVEQWKNANWYFIEASSKTGVIYRFDAYIPISQDFMFVCNFMELGDITKVPYLSGNSIEFSSSIYKSTNIPKIISEFIADIKFPTSILSDDDVVFYAKNIIAPSLETYGAGVMYFNANDYLLKNGYFPSLDDVTTVHPRSYVCAVCDKVHWCYYGDDKDDCCDDNFEVPKNIVTYTVDGTMFFTKMCPSCYETYSRMCEYCGITYYDRFERHNNRYCANCNNKATAKLINKGKDNV